MEEKKLTDEEIVKALDICYNSPCCSADCPYFNKNGRNFCVENKAFYGDLKRILQEHAEQKAEIERLKEKSISHYRDSWKNKFFKAQEELERLTEELKYYRGELQ